MKIETVAVDDHQRDCAWDGIRWMRTNIKKLWKNGKKGKIKKINGVLNGTTC